MVKGRRDRGWGCLQLMRSFAVPFTAFIHCPSTSLCHTSLSMADSPQAGPSCLAPGPTPYHETSQYRNWRYSPTQLSAIRAELNAKSVEVFTRNSELEKVYPSLCPKEIRTKSDIIGGAERDGPRFSTSPSYDLPLCRR